MEIISRAISESTSYNIPDWLQIFSFLGTVATGMFSLRFIKSNRNKAKEAQDKSVTLLRQDIYNRLPDRRLLSERSVRSLASTIQAVHKTPAITDKIIAEAIRGAAYDVEKHYRGQSRFTRLSILNDLLSSLSEESRGLPLLTVARTDPVGFYAEGQVSLLILGILLSSSILIGRRWIFPEACIQINLLNIVSSDNQCIDSSWIMVIIGLVVLMLEFLIATSIRRAAAYWGSESTGSELDMVIGRAKMNPFLDFVTLAALSVNSPIISLVWAPLAETTGMLRPVAFAEMHEYRWGRAQELRQLVEKRERDLLVARLDGLGSAEEARISYDLADLCCELWVVTGSTRYRDRANHYRPAAD